MTIQQSLQEKFAPQSICFGCGPANPQGLQIKSYVVDDHLIAYFKPKSYHHAFPNCLNGGIIGTLLDCHCNWAASYYLMQAENLSQPPCTVTAEYTIKLLRPTPMENELTLIATLEKITHNRAHTKGELIANNKICATCTGVFVAVDERHPAFHRW